MASKLSTLDIFLSKKNDFSSGICSFSVFMHREHAHLNESFFLS